MDWIICRGKAHRYEATIVDRKLGFLKHYGSLDGLSPDGTLEVWGYEWLIKPDTSEINPEHIVLAGGQYMDEDGYICFTNGQIVVALHYPDGSYDILGEEPHGDGIDFFGYHNSTEESIYDWYVKKYNLDLPLYVEDWIDLILIGDGRDEADEHKISEEHVRSIWNDDDLYTIHYDVDIEAARNELQGTGTASRFGENYIYAEAIITAALYSREKFKGTGTPDFFCTPHLVNVMLLARDTNGRRIYNSKADLAAALNINELHTAEQFEGLARTDKTGKKHNLLGIFVNLSDYTVGSTKGGEITRFNQFDIDFNQEKYLIETRMSGALTRLWSAIALEEPVKASSGQTEDAGHDGT